MVRLFPPICEWDTSFSNSQWRGNHQVEVVVLYHLLRMCGWIERIGAFVRRSIAMTARAFWSSKGSIVNDGGSHLKFINSGLDI